MLRGERRLGLLGQDGLDRWFLAFCATVFFGFRGVLAVLLLLDAALLCNDGLGVVVRQ